MYDAGAPKLFVRTPSGPKARTCSISTAYFRRSEENPRKKDRPFLGQLLFGLMTQALRDEGLAGTSRINVIRVYGFNIGGPFVKDKAWFYGSYGVQDIQNISRFNMPRKTILETFLAKMNFQIVPQNRLEIFAEGKGKLKVGTDPDTFNPKGYDRPGLQHFGYPVFRIQDEHMFGANVFASLKFGYWDGGSLTRIPSHKFLYTISETGYFQGVVKLPPRRFADPLRGATPPPSNSPAVMRLTGFYLIQGISETHH